MRTTLPIFSASRSQCWFSESIGKSKDRNPRSRCRPQSLPTIRTLTLVDFRTGTAVFKNQVEIATKSAHAAGRRVWAGIGAYRIPSESTVEKINAARILGSDGIILFSYDFTTRRSELNPDGAYLQRVSRAAFEPSVVASP